MTDSRPDTLRRSLLMPPPGLLPLALLAVLWLVTFNHYPHLPADLPSRFVPWGEPVSWAPKSPAYFVLPATGTLIYLVLGMLQLLGARQPIVDGQHLRGPAARAVGRMIRRYLFFMRCALLAWLINLEFRITQLAYGDRSSLGWDSYVVAMLLALYGVLGAWLLLRGSRRWLAHQEREREA